MSEGFPIPVQMTKGDRTFTSDAPALTLIPANDAPMHETRRTRRWFFGGELAVSLLLHTLVAVALTGVVARQFGEPQVDPISVELVAPPEIETPEPQVPELKIPEPEKPKVEEEKPEDEKAAVPPPPPPPPPEEQQAEPEQTEEPEETAPTVMQPVVEFGDTDSGPREALDGTAAEETETPEQTEEAPTEPEQATQETEEPEEGQPAEAEPSEASPAETAEVEETPQPEESQPEETPPEETQLEEAKAEEAKPEEAQTEQAQPDQLAEAAATEAPAPEAVAETETPTEDFGTVGPIVTAALPAPKPAQRPAARSASNAAANSAGGGGNSGRQTPRLAEARRLFSASILGDTRARTAMAGMPPGQRLNLLCMTELRAQLIDWDPARPPEMLPSFRPKAGNVLEPGQAAYGSRGDWYDLNFRCETDKDVKRVVKFSFRIGPPIPPAKWQGRGLPPF
jgi:hypothetical protein